MQRREDETLDRFHTRLRKLATNCEFGDINKAIKILLCKALLEDISLEDYCSMVALCLLACSRLSVERDDQTFGRATSDEQGLVEKKGR